MDNVIDELVKLVPFAKFFHTIGISNEMSVTLTTVSVLAYGYGFKLLWDHLQNSKVARELTPYYNYKQVESYCKYYIQTKFQNFSPSRYEEPKETHRYGLRESLISFLMKNAFNEKKESNKYYLILADSGMGKTTFMVNLYMKYTSFFNFNRKYNIKFIHLGDKNSLDKIKEVSEEEAKKTILLLDAFDEDKNLIPPDIDDNLTDDERFRNHFDKIIDVAQNFQEVVITSRTQYFPGQENDPYDLKVPRYDDSGYHTLHKMYLSPFKDNEIKKYLSKKYGVFRFWNNKKKKIALDIVKKSPKLMVRPMLLSYIDYFVESNNIYSNCFEIYETLINKWIEREANKRQANTEQREKFKKDLHTYSILVALEIYNNRESSDMLSLMKDEAIKIAKDNNINLADYQITGQSLLTRDAEGNWKFAHKSIYEFIIANEAVKSPKDWINKEFDSMDMTRKFISEKFPEIPTNFSIIKGGLFWMGSPESEVERVSNETLHQVMVSDFNMSKYAITVAQFEEFIKETNYSTDADKNYGITISDEKQILFKSGNNWSYDTRGEIQKDKQHPVINVSWNDANEYCKWLSAKLSVNFRLPTEAEWEYGCRAAKKTPFNTGENLTTEQANYFGNYPYNNAPKGNFIGDTKIVGRYKPNDLGLFDMHGNVREWCVDWYQKDYYRDCKKNGIVQDPKGPENGSHRVLRGGGWHNNARNCRSANRLGALPDERNFDIGFRVVFVR